MHTDDIKIKQKDVVREREDLEGEIVEGPEQVQKSYLDALAFAEEPVTIRIERSSEKYAPKVIDLWCNGKGAEVLQNGRWLELKVLPVGIPVTTKRKYVEILARSKVDTVNTRVGDERDERPINEIERYTSSRAPFSVIEDKNPKGAAWLTGLVHFN